VNAAFLLVTTAWFAGADAAAPAKAAPAPAPAPAAVAPASSCCGGNSGTCDTGCDSCCKESLFSKLKGHFHKSCDCCETCAPAPTCNTCDTCCKESHFSKLKGHFHKSCDTCNTCAPAPAPTCNTCDTCCKESLFSKLKGHFHKSCCDTCDTCGTAAPAPAGAMPKAGESIPAPKDANPAKKMPEGKQTQLIAPQPIAAPALEVTPTVAPKATEVEKTPF